MSYKRCEMSLIIPLQPSRLLNSLLVLFGLIAAGVLLLLEFNPLLKVAGLLILLFQCRYYYRHYFIHKTPCNIQQLIWHGNGDWAVHFKGENQASPATISSVFYCRWCIGFFLHIGDQRITLLFPPDRLDRDTFRRLHVRLKIKQ